VSLILERRWRKLNLCMNQVNFVTESKKKSFKEHFWILQTNFFIVSVYKIINVNNVKVYTTNNNGLVIVVEESYPIKINTLLKTTTALPHFVLWHNKLIRFTTRSFSRFAGEME